MSFTDRKPFTVTEKDVASFSRYKKRFNCRLCGHNFDAGDTARLIYANGAESPVHCGNFFVCSKCDGDDKDVLQCAKLGFEQAVKLAKQWDIYGPEWQD